jgi:chondroitin 4-sulfotransferase 11
MLILAGYSEKELDHPSKQLSFMARDAYGDAEPDTETLEQTLKLLVVRHPFERLVSGYKDKLSNATIGM